MDEFAQTRGVDDLFDDDIVPVTAQAEEIPAEQDLSTDAYPAELVTPAVEAHPYNDNRNNAVPPEYRKRGIGRGRAHGERGRGRGRGFGRGGRDAGAATRDMGQEKGETPAPVPAPANAEDQEHTDEKNESTPPNGEEDDLSKEPGKSKVYAVKGDRSGTGGVKKVRIERPLLTSKDAHARKELTRLRAFSPN